MTIETGYPMPAPTRRGGGPWNYNMALRTAIASLKPGAGTPEDESFVYPNGGHNVYCVAYAMGIKIRTIKENGRGTRIWRVK